MAARSDASYSADQAANATLNWLECASGILWAWRKNAADGSAFEAGTDASALAMETPDGGCFEVPQH